MSNNNNNNNSVSNNNSTNNINTNNNSINNNNNNNNLIDSTDNTNNATNNNSTSNNSNNNNNNTNSSNNNINSINNNNNNSIQQENISTPTIDPNGKLKSVKSMDSGYSQITAQKPSSWDRRSLRGRSNSFGPSDLRGSSSSVEQHAGKHNHNTTVVAKHVAMKMLTASSRNYKLQDELAKPQNLALLLDCLDGTDEQIVLQATATLANIAMNIETHLQIQVENVEIGLLKLLKHSNPRIQYHAARGLVYMGSEEVEDIYIYDFLPDEDSSPSVIYTESDARTFIRGCTIENLVLTLTNDINLLWDGSSSSHGKDRKESSRSGGKSRSKNTPSEYHITNFILSTLQTFVHPVIFMRLLLHRFHDPEAYKLFLAIQDPEESMVEAPHMEHFAPLPVLHARIMRILITWLENYPNDFVTFPIIRLEVEKLIGPMKVIDGPYAPCAQKLEELFGKLCEVTVSHSVYHVEFEGHHNHLYEQCQRAIKDGRLPCSEEDFVYLAGLQLYIEDLCEYGRDFAERLKTIDSITSTRMKVSIGPTIGSSKHLTKKIKGVYEIFLQDQPTERNAKHNYVDCCQGMLGYGCTFFKVKQRIPHKGSRKKVYISRLFGISPKRVLILDERLKVSVETFSCKDLRRWDPLEDSLTLKALFKTRANVEKTIEFQLDNRVTFKELSNCILTCTMENNYQVIYFSIPLT